MHIGRFEVGRNSKNVAVSLFSDTSLDLVTLFENSVLPSSRLYEIRYDLFAKKSGPDLKYLIGGLGSLDISYIFTFRGVPEEVIKFNKIAVDMNVPALDVDLSLAGTVGRNFGNTIVSQHLSDRRPTVREMEELLDENCGMVKLAVTYGDYGEFMQDCLKSLELRKRFDKPFTLVPMGEKSRGMRIASFVMVSDLAYARLEKETAPGQLTYEEYRKILRMLD